MSRYIVSEKGENILYFGTEGVQFTVSMHSARCKMVIQSLLLVKFGNDQWLVLSLGGDFVWKLVPSFFIVLGYWLSLGPWWIVHSSCDLYCYILNVWGIDYCLTLKMDCMFCSFLHMLSHNMHMGPVCDLSLPWCSSR
jgi:hypothetical protein